MCLIKYFSCSYHSWESYFLKTYVYFINQILWGVMWMLGHELRFSVRATVTPNHWAISLALWESHFLGGSPIHWALNLCLLFGWGRLKCFCRDLFTLSSVWEELLFPQSRTLGQNGSGEGSPTLNMQVLTKRVGCWDRESGGKNIIQLYFFLSCYQDFPIWKE